MDVGRLRTRLSPLLIVALSGCASVFGPTTATSFMRQVETSPDPNVRFKAYKSLGESRVYDDGAQRAAAARLLVENLDPKKEPLASRAVICRSLGELGDPVAREPLLRLIRDPDAMIRAEAYRALGKVGHKEDSTVLMQAMTLDSDNHCRVAAIEALGSLKEVDPRTEPYLVRRIDGNAEQDPRIRYAALKSLRKISGKDFSSGAEPWRAYVLAKYGEKIDPAPATPTAIADVSTLDRSASPASLVPSFRPLGATGKPTDPWDRTAPDPTEEDAPYLTARPNAAVQANPGQTPLPSPPSTPRSLLSKMLGY